MPDCSLSFTDETSLMFNNSRRRSVEFTPLKDRIEEGAVVCMGLKSYKLLYVSLATVCRGAEMSQWPS